MGDDIFDVGLLEEAQPAADVVGDVAANELGLERGAVGMGAVQHRHLGQGNALIAQLQHALRDEGRFLVDVVEGDRRRPLPCRAHGAEGLLVLLGVVRDAGIRQRENARHTAVIHFETENFGLGIALRKFQNVGVVRAAKLVNGLTVVPDDHQVAAILGGEELDDLGLQVIGVLVLIHEQVLEEPAVLLQERRMLSQELMPVAQEIVVIHRVGCALLRLVALRHALDLLRPLAEVGKAVGQHLRNRQVGVECRTHDLAEHRRVREARLGHLELQL